MLFRSTDANIEQTDNILVCNHVIA